MTGTRSIHNLALIGFMGTGKSSVGRVAADMLHFTFLDTDHVIQARAGKAVSDIFAQDGEPAFRQWERRIVEELTRRTKTVIATGGGLPADEANLNDLAQFTLSGPPFCKISRPASVRRPADARSMRLSTPGTRAPGR